MYESQFRILAESSNGYIGVCSCCREFNFAYKTMLLTFQEDSMVNFFEWVSTNRYSPEYYFPLHHGRNRILPSPAGNLFLTYSDEEMEEIIQLYHEAKLILDAERILISKN